MARGTADTSLIKQGYAKVEHDEKKKKKKNIKRL